MQKRLPTSARASSCDDIQAEQLPGLIEGWLLTSDINRCSARNILNRRKTMGRLVWFRNEKSVKACDTLAFKPFFHYLNHAHKESGGCWGNRFGDKPTKPGTAKTYYEIFRGFLNYLIAEEVGKTFPMSRHDLHVAPFVITDMTRFYTIAR